MRLLVAVVLASVLTGCASNAREQTPTPVGTTTVIRSTPVATAVATSPDATPTASAGRPAFLLSAFTDVRDGQQFRLTDFPGKTVLVIGMAVW